MKIRQLAVLLCSVSVVASATTMIAVDVPEMTRISTQVVRGTVVSSTPRWNGDHSRILTDTVIDVAETYKGPQTKRVNVMQPGGEVGDIGQKVEGVAQFKVGEQVVVFLEGRGDSALVTGMSQGKFTLSTQADGKVVALQAVTEALLLDAQTRQPVHQSARKSLTLDECKALHENAGFEILWREGWPDVAGYTFMNRLADNRYLRKAARFTGVYHQYARLILPACLEGRAPARLRPAGRPAAPIWRAPLLCE